jgi:hypothetical protein
MELKMQGRKAEQTSTLEYVLSMLVQLRQLADADGDEMLAYLIEMAIIEARDEISARKSEQIGGQKRNSAA